MDQYDWQWQRIKAESELKDLHGDGFEALFQTIATRLWRADFSGTIPMGRRGDLKCDGFRYSTGTVYQCYGPRYGHANVNEAIKKIDDDFRGAKRHWGDLLREWRFVINLYSDRAPSEIVRKIAELAQELDVPASPMFRSEIISLIESLPPDVRAELYGRAPRSTDMISITYANLSRALATIRRAIAIDPRDPVQLSAPLAAKVEFNALSRAARHFISIGQSGAPKVSNYLADQVDPEESERMAHGFKTRYADCVQEAFEPDKIFAEMVKFAGGGTGDPERETVALAIVTYFFVTCQIFEAPRMSAEQ